MSDGKQRYYGGFFWLAMVSFVVPLVVAFQAFQAVRPASKPTPAPDASGVDHQLWDYLLKAYVARGLVDYDGLARDHLFRTYLSQLGGARPEALATEADRLALLCNAYNAFVINGVIVHQVSASVLDPSVEVDGMEFFDLKEHIFAGETMSLNHLEHEIIRKEFDEPRVHVALVCAARSCPPIRPEAYVGGRLDSQLADQARLFANDRRHVQIDPAAGEVRLNAILNWYGEDWEGHGGVLPWLAGLVEDAESRAALEAAAEGKYKVVFLEYDWSLNSRQERASGPARQGGEFGSGSIPNE